MLSHKLSLCKFNKIEIILRIFSEHNTMILEINYKKKNFRKHKHMKANDILLNNTSSLPSGNPLSLALWGWWWVFLVEWF